jgi:phosphatidylserine/phosphatidylglycerophosphate/cardiolipin synthase-like enzyme
MLTHARIRWLLPLLLLLIVSACGPQETVVLSENGTGVEVYFSPQGGCTEAIVTALDAAKNSILVQAYSFTSAPISKALVNAHKRGVKIAVILDQSQRTEEYSAADFVQHAGIPTYIDAEHAIAHNKIIVIDGQTVITGSFNFTRQAEERNAENLLVIHSREIASKYTANWNAHLAHSKKYERQTKGTSETPRPAERFHSAHAGDHASGEFVASRNSEWFHRMSCKAAGKISPKNLVKYATRDEAIQAGKKPCAECMP